MIRIRVLYGTCFLLSRDRIGQVQALFRESFPRLARYAEKIPSLLRDPVRHGYRTALLVAESALGRVDAFALVIHFEDIKATFLDFIASRPGVRGQGLGSALYEAVREWCVAVGARSLYMEVQPDEPELTPETRMLEEAKKRIAFYEKYGVRVVENPAYATPVGDPPTTAFLLFDPLGRPDPLGREEAREAVSRILTQRFAQVTDPAFVRHVVEGFTEDPVRLRPLRYHRRKPANPPERRPPQPPFAIVLTPRHEIHHVKERGYFERPVRIQAIRDALDGTGLFTSVTCRKQSERHILAVHDEKFVQYLQTVSSKLKAPRPLYPDTFPLRQLARRPRELPVQAGYYCIDSGTPLYPNAYIAARASANAAITAAEELVSGRRLVYAVCRPPGHHAGKRFFGGFCYFNNAAIAAQYLLPEARVAILDLDYHHGNGTQDIFYDRDDVLTVSIHGHPDYSYPYFSGYSDETGEGRGLGCNVNFPLPPNTDEKRYFPILERAFERIRQFRPELLIIAFGFDIMKGDPTGRFLLRSASLRVLGERLMSLGLPILVIQEGGYNLRNIRNGAHAFFTGCAKGAGNV